MVEYQSITKPTLRLRETQGPTHVIGNQNEVEKAAKEALEAQMEE